MSDLRFNCPHCGAVLQVLPALYGESLECPACSQSIIIPPALLTQRGSGKKVVERVRASKAKAEQRVLEEALKEVASLPTRNDAAANRELLLIFFGAAVFALLFIPMGLIINSLEPAGAGSQIFHFGLLLALVSPFLCIYSVAKGIHYLLKRLNAQALCEFLLRYKGMFDIRGSEPSGGVLPFIVPSHRKRYADVFYSLYTICQAEVEKHGSAYAECHSWIVNEGRDKRTATCLIVFVRKHASAEGRLKDHPLGKLTLQAVMSNARNWYLCLPKPKNFNTAFRLDT